jgi:Flp pilus assembly protein TadD/mono/diheme cytochrome c family protein
VNVYNIRRIVLALALTRAAGAEAPPTFARDIAPVVYRNCASCHRPGQHAPFSLISYEDVKKHAAQIEVVTRRGSMPPWLPENGYGDFNDERRLTAKEIETIARWVSAGAPEGPSAEIPQQPAFNDEWQLGKPDLVLDAQGSFELPALGSEIYWNFIFKPALTTRRWVRAVEIRPGQQHLVHHANLLVDRQGSAHLQESAPGKGFPGMDLVILRSPFDPDGNFLFWKPGSMPHVEPDGFAWRLDPGNELVLNTHLRPNGMAEQVRPSIGLYFTDRPQSRFPLLLQLENDAALDIQAGNRDFVISDDFRLPLDADILAVYPHAHYLGKLLEAWATLPDGSKKWLIRIPDWNPDWQAVYYYRSPLFLPKDAVIHMRYHYDNSTANARNPNRPPRRVRAGNQSTDEMSHLWLEVLPRGAADQRLKLQEAVMRHRLEKNPRDFVAHMDLGAILLSRLNAPAAVSELRVAVQLEPNHPEVCNMLGLGLATLGRNAEAIGEFELALRERPDYASARFNLATALAKSGKIDDAVENLRQLLATNPDDLAARERLADALTVRGTLLLRNGKSSEALAQFDEALKLDPSNEAARANREQALRH